MIIGVLNQKGGAGKTTLSTSLAHSLKLRGLSVLLIDADPQGSARDWNERNGGTVVPVIGLDRETLPIDIRTVKNHYDYVVIDGAPQVARLAAAAVKASDVVLIPVQPSPYDVWAASDLIDVIRARQEVTNGSPKAAFVVSRAIKNTKLSSDVAESLEAYGLPVFVNGTTQRVAYATTAISGQTVLSESVSNPAAHEINAITDELLEFARKR